MATQGIVSVIAGGKTIQKVVAGSDGMRSTVLASMLQRWCAQRGVPSEMETLELARKAGFGGMTSSLTIVSENLIVNVEDGDVSNEPMYARYRKTFADPADNPRWEHHITEYCYFVDLTSGKVIHYIYDIDALSKEQLHNEILGE